MCWGDVERESRQFESGVEGCHGLANAALGLHLFVLQEKLSLLKMLGFRLEMLHLPPQLLDKNQKPIHAA